MLPLFSIGQHIISPITIADRCVKLSKQGKLDSVAANVSIYIKDRWWQDPKQFYVYIDTLKFENGFYGIGKIILDTLMKFEGRPVNDWVFYYPDGKLFSKGKYSIGAYTDCGPAGYQTVGYSYEVGMWQYWYNKGNVMAAGKYGFAKEILNNSCGIDTTISPKIMDDWKFYKQDGIVADDPQEMIKQISSDHGGILYFSRY